jgi:ABC-2 type transport system permease protein
MVPRSILAVWSLWAREWLRFVRQRNRVLGALGTPVLFWAFFGSGFGSSFRPPGSPAGLDYLAWFYPGALLMVVLFTAIFSSISIIEDRTAGFLQGVLVAPVPRLAIVLGKVLGGATLGAAQGLLLLPLAPLAGIALGPGAVAALAAELLLIGLTLSAVGFLFAWRMDSVQGFHAVMNLLLFPMWLLSGAFFPASAASGWLRALMTVNPLTYGLGALRAALDDPARLAGFGVPGAGVSLTVLIFAASGALALAARTAGRPEA